MNWSKNSWRRLLTIAAKVLRIATISLVVAVAGLFIVVVTGMWLSGKSFLDRGPPSKDDYIAHCFDYVDGSHVFEGSQVEKVDFAWRGAIGGIVTVARAEFKGPVKVNDGMVDAKVKAGEFTIGTYDPAKTTEGDKLMLRHQFTVANHGETPSWLDFPFNRKMRMLTENVDRGPDPDHPRYPRNTIWYIDDERNVVYMYGCWG
jgi:hypothetical protein